MKFECTCTYRLKFYQVVFGNFQRCSAVDVFKMKVERLDFRNLKLSSHNRVIEKGRHLSIPKIGRLCYYCNTGSTED